MLDSCFSGCGIDVFCKIFRQGGAGVKFRQHVRRWTRRHIECFTFQATPERKPTLYDMPGKLLTAASRAFHPYKVRFSGQQPRDITISCFLKCLAARGLFYRFWPDGLYFQHKRHLCHPRGTAKPCSRNVARRSSIDNFCMFVPELYSNPSGTFIPSIPLYRLTSGLMT